MKRSFGESDSMRHEVDRKESMKELEDNIGSLEQLDCPLCTNDIDHYYSACARVTHLQREMQVSTSSKVLNIYNYHLAFTKLQALLKGALIKHEMSNVRLMNSTFLP